MYAQIIDGTITATRRTLPDTARRLDSGDTVLGFPSADADTVAACGWFEVVETADPPYDNTTQRRDRTIEVVDGRPVVVWTVSDLTPDELAAKARADADDQERDQVRQMLAWLTEVAQDARQSTENRRFARILRALIRDQYGA